MEVKCSSNKPIQHKIGPGRIGRIAPKTPAKVKSIPSKSKNISIRKDNQSSSKI